MTLKDTIYKILTEHPETRDSDKKLQWIILKELDLVEKYSYSFDTGVTFGKLCITEDNFMKAPEFESVRRCRQALQRTDLLSGAKLIQPTKSVKEKRIKLSKEKGYSYQQGREPTFNPLTQTYEY